MDQLFQGTSDDLKTHPEFDRWLLYSALSDSFNNIQQIKILRDEYNYLIEFHGKIVGAIATKIIILKIIRSNVFAPIILHQLSLIPEDQRYIINKNIRYILENLGVNYSIY